LVLYPVVAAELGEESLLNQLLPTTYQPYLRGPFHVLAEQPSNDAINFVTGAGAFLQQVIYGYTGLRLEEGGLRACFKPMLPAGIRRLVLRNFVVDGRKQDVVVDRSGLRFEQGEVAA
jgi:trehalose/maltose hydrolase-like predicted phosphorylase